MSDKGKERLKGSIQREFNSIQKQVLDYAELVIPIREQYQQFRRKVLDVTNDIRRNLELDININYDVDYTPNTECEDIVIIGNNVKVDYKRKGKVKNGKGKE